MRTQSSYARRADNALSIFDPDAPPERSKQYWYWGKAKPAPTMGPERTATSHKPCKKCGKVLVLVSDERRTRGMCSDCRQIPATVEVDGPDAGQHDAHNRR